jgi:hypothetical protein
MESKKRLLEWDAQKQQRLTKKKKIDPLEKCWRSIKSSSKSRDKDFEIEKDFAYSLFVKNCVYCGSNKTPHSLDRINNKMGYVRNNVVPCCTRCNIMKSNWSVKDFIQACINIQLHNSFTSMDIIDPRFSIQYKFEVNKDYKSSTYSVYQYNAWKKNINFELDELGHRNLCSGNCVYCGRQPTKNLKNGIDRLNNNLGYVTGNMVSCCPRCNYMKLKISWVEFIIHCSRVGSYSGHRLYDSNGHTKSEREIRNTILKSLDNGP